MRHDLLSNTTQIVKRRDKQHDTTSKTTRRVKQHDPPRLFQIVHCPGKTNSASDAISRHPTEKDSTEFKQSIHPPNWPTHLEHGHSIATIRGNFQSLSWDSIAEETQKDPVTRPLQDIVSEHHLEITLPTSRHIGHYVTTSE